MSVTLTRRFHQVFRSANMLAYAFSKTIRNCFSIEWTKVPLITPPDICYLPQKGNSTPTRPLGRIFQTRPATDAVVLTVVTSWSVAMYTRPKRFELVTAPPPVTESQ